VLRLEPGDRHREAAGVAQGEGGIERTPLLVGRDEHRLAAGTADGLDVGRETGTGCIAASVGAERRVRTLPDEKAEGGEPEDENGAPGDECREAKRVPLRSASGVHDRILHSRDEADRPPGYGGPP